MPEYSAFHNEPNHIGGKARGLFALPQAWVPDFVVLSRSFWESWRTLGARKTMAALPAQERSLFDDFINRNAGSPSPRYVIVRSNSPEEHSVRTRGKHSSLAVPCTVEDIVAAIDQILGQNAEKPVFAIIQQYIQPAWRGHMSNERRISPKRSLWMVESSPALPNLSREGIIRAKRVNIAGPLLAHTQQELLQVLRFTAGMLMQKERGYYHCEWAWDGKRLWLVQADRADPNDELCLGNKYIDSTDDFDVSEHIKFSWLQHFTATATERWKKLKRPTMFQKLGWPTANVYVLTGEQWKSSSTLGHQELSEELSILSKHPVVVRCDIATDVPREDILLSTSNPTTDINELIGFMNRESAYFREQGLLERDWAFLLAVLVPARASAMIHAHPDGQVARVDSVCPASISFFP